MKKLIFGSIPADVMAWSGGFTLVPVSEEQVVLGDVLNYIRNMHTTVRFGLPLPRVGEPIIGEFDEIYVVIGADCGCDSRLQRFAKIILHNPQKIKSNNLELEIYLN